MEKEKNMDKRPSSPTFSMNSLAPEINNIPVSGFINHTTLDDDELMQCNDLLDKEELTCFNIHANMSLESRSLLSGSWSCSTDSVLSEVITSFDQDVNEVIKAVCQSFFDPEKLEKEAVDSVEKEEVQTTESISTSRLTIGSDKSLSSSSTETVIVEAAKTLVSLVYDKAVKELEAIEAAKTPKDADSLKTLQSTHSEKVLEEADSLKTLQSTDSEKVLEDANPLKTLQSTDSETVLEEVDPLKTLQSTDSETVLEDADFLKTLQSTDSEKVLEANSLKTLEDTDTLQMSQGKRCFSRDQRKVHPAPYLDETVRSPSTDWTMFCTGQSKQGSCGSQETATITSSSGDESADLKPVQQELVDRLVDKDPTGVEKTKAKKSNRFLDFFRNVFSKKNIKKKKKVAVEENHSKWPSFWMHKLLL
ncbi:hypothetical protein D5F01_LYC01799 [Larimichthys crocea]|uniref:Uncharacterized protein n=1 Tax=Larimichthys crocea TaxID=215358 RepID=A0A6G0J6K2_LARCR|nr:hypothetical protein D5F01_LYC01799 [Larimichthys crocea]